MDNPGLGDLGDLGVKPKAGRIKAEQKQDPGYPMPPTFYTELEIHTTEIRSFYDGVDGSLSELTGIKLTISGTEYNFTSNGNPIASPSPSNNYSFMAETDEVPGFDYSLIGIGTLELDYGGTTEVFAVALVSDFENTDPYEE